MHIYNTLTKKVEYDGNQHGIVLNVRTTNHERYEVRFANEDGEYVLTSAKLPKLSENYKTDVFGNKTVFSSITSSLQSSATPPSNNGGSSGFSGGGRSGGGGGGGGGGGF